MPREQGVIEVRCPGRDLQPGTPDRPAALEFLQVQPDAAFVEFVESRFQALTRDTAADFWQGDAGVLQEPAVRAARVLIYTPLQNLEERLLTVGQLPLDHAKRLLL